MMNGSMDTCFNDMNSNQLLYSQEPSKKRKMNDGTQTMDHAIAAGIVVRGRSFLPIQRDCGTYQTEEWKSSVIFLPVMDDMYINMMKYDKVSAEQGSFFVGDESGSYAGSETGHALHLWRYDKNQRKCYIALSFLFTEFQEFQKVQRFMDSA